MLVRYPLRKIDDWSDYIEAETRSSVRFLMRKRSRITAAAAPPFADQREIKSPHPSRQSLCDPIQDDSQLSLCDASRAASYTYTRHYMELLLSR